MNQALEKHVVDMRVFSVVNDTIRDLSGGRYYNKESVAAVSLVVNMQWGNFSSSHLPLTEYYVSLDVESTKPGGRIFEKLVSGMCLGEIVRRVLLKMPQEVALFGDRVPSKLAIPYILRPPDMAAMHQDTSEDYEVVNEKLKQIFEIKNSTPMVREIVAEVCDVVTERGARLVGAVIVGIVKRFGRIKKKKSVIMVCRSIIAYLETIFTAVFGWEVIFQTM
ncbi:hypothetical protein Pfo_019303 [Paulownia fortunei]|nr:hypothetical protein Pfo_019303 [Paulownia fortunei]